MHSRDSENLFLKRLIQLRTSKGVSAREMSLSLGQNENYINKIENRLSLPSLTGFFYICEYFNISPEDFFSSSKNPLKASELFSMLEILDNEEIEHLIFIANDISKNKPLKKDK